MSVYRNILCLLLVLMTTFGAAAQEKWLLTERSAESALLKGVEDYDNGDYDAAEAVFRLIGRKYPGNDAAWYYLGLCRVARRDMSGAEEYLRKAIGIDPDNYWYRFRLAAVYAATGRPEITGTMYEDLLRDFPKKNELYYNLVDVYMAQGRYEKALETLDKLETVFGRSDATVVTRYGMLLRLNRQEEAHEGLLEYNRDYSSPQVLTMLGDYEASLYRDSTAVAYYDEALGLASDYMPAYLGKAEIYRMTGRYDSFFPMMTGFMSREDVPPAGKSNYLTELCRHSDPKFLKLYRTSVDGLFDSALATAPKDSSLLFASGVYYFSTERKDLADSCFSKVAREYPNDKKAVATYISFLSYKADWKALEEESIAAWERFPDEPGFLDYAAGAAYNLEDYDKVISIYTVMAEWPSFDTDTRVRALAGVGDIYNLKGDSRNAFKFYGKALGLSPDYLPVLNNYAYYLSVEHKKLRKAYAMSKKTVEAEPDNPTYLDTFGWILYLTGRYDEAKGYFKHAMLYGGKESAVILDHYAEVLYALKEYDLAFVYWRQALARDWKTELPGLDEKIAARRAEKERR